MSSARWSRRTWIAGAAFALAAAGAGVGLGGAARPEMQPAKVAAFSPLAVDTAVVLVHVRRHTGPTSAVAKTGTGVVLAGGRIVTATHLFGDAWNDVEIIFGGRNGHLEQSIIWTGEPTHIEKRDVTMLTGVKIPEWVQPVKLSKRPPLVNDAVVSIGLSRPSRPRIRGGIIDEVQLSGSFLIDVNSSEGDSGGPTFNQNNELVGIHDAVETRTLEGTWGKRTDVFSVSARVTDVPQVKAEPQTPSKQEKKP